jgi:hypothetical protein
MVLELLMKLSRIFKTLPALALAVSAGTVSADLIYDADVTNDVIFGSGNANGGFTVDQNNGIELGLRGKLRFNEDNQPENTFNSNGDGSYTFLAGNPPTGFGFDPGNPTTPVWNFEWSINSDFNQDPTSDAPIRNLNDLVYALTLDIDPGPGFQAQGPIFSFFDPINVAYADHAIGNNFTASGEGTVADGNADYSQLIDSNNLAQNSWSYEFFNSPSNNFTAGFDPTVPGDYLIRLSAFDRSPFEGGQTLASTSINIKVASVPEPGTLALLGLGLAGLSLTRRRRS